MIAIEDIDKKMIKITVRERQNSSVITIQGHARFAPKGQDIVCSAISTLYYSLHRFMVYNPPISAGRTPPNIVMSNLFFSLADSIFFRIPQCIFSLLVIQITFLKNKEWSTQKGLTAILAPT